MEREVSFDMISKVGRDAIHHHEEEIFSLVFEDPDFPEMNALWENFYNGPTLNLSQINSLTHELIALKAIVPTLNHLEHSVDRLIGFFSRSWKAESTVKCISD